MSPKRKVIVIEDSSDSEMDFTEALDVVDEDFEVDDDVQAAIQASLAEQVPQSGERVRQPPSPALAADVSFGRRGWKKDLAAAKQKWGVEGELEGYAGMIGTLRGLKNGDADDSVSLLLTYEDLDGREFKLQLELVFQDIPSYPTSYKLLIFSSSTLPKRADLTFSRFTDIHDLELPSLLSRLLSSLQGDDEADGGVPNDFEDGIDEDADDDLGVETDPWADAPLQGANVFEGMVEDRHLDRKLLKQHFEQAKKYGYRPGLTKVSDFWIISYSIPLKNLPIDPNVLGMWDDGLVDAWKKDQRIVLLMGTETYPPRLDSIRYWLGLHKDYKPPLDVMIATTRGSGMQDFYLSAPLVNFLKFFPRCHKLRTSFPLNWTSANQVGMDDEATRRVFVDGVKPKNTGRREKDDPVTKGMQENIPLCAFWWMLNRFIDAPKYCLNCGLEVAIPSLRPYVCDKPLCLYGFMSLGLGPSVEHTIITHPAVVDLLLSFTYSSASSQARMDFPLHLHIEVPPDFGIPHAQLIDGLTDEVKRRALTWLINKLPKVSEIRARLESGEKLKSLDVPSGSIGVLRWVVGSCRAYLKETKAGEGVQIGAETGAKSHTDLKQTTFVVGSPEQETNFRDEIAIAKEQDKNCLKYPTLLAFHGSAAQRWHNILRTGLDFSETVNGRAYGHGVYFASDSMTSMGTYAAHNQFARDNTDFKVSNATALVELVNVPKTFQSQNPYYVVSNTKQIKPFLLLVQGHDTAEETEEAKEVEQDIQTTRALFQHDPTLQQQPSMYASPLKVHMPEKLIRTTYIDDDPDDATDQAIFNPPPLPISAGPAPAKSKKHKRSFSPSPQSRFDRLELMPPPSETSIVATKTLAKELKSLIKVQEESELPFYVDPEGDNLYCWLLELHAFPPDSHLYAELKERNLQSIIAELRFPASFPHSPPFMRIIHPRMLPFTNGGGGNITGGGSVCNELMTSTGWNPAFNVEAIVREVMGWEIPKGFDRLAK